MSRTQRNLSMPAVSLRLMWLLRCISFLAVLLVSLSAQGAISWVGSGATATSTNSNSRSLTIPTIVNDDILVAHVAVRGNRTITAPAGWTLVDQVYVSGSKITQGIYYRVGLSTDSGTTATWNFSSSDDNAGVIRAYRGVDTVTPIGNADGNTGNSSTLTAPSINTTAPNEWLLTFYGAADGRSSTFSTPSGMTERYDFDNNGDNSGLALAGDDEVRATTGASGTRVSTSSRSDSYVAQLIALKPPPTVLSIARADANPSGAASVSWTVTFSSNVSGVNSSNFALINSGLGGSPAITSVTGGGTTWTVTASTGTGSGTLGLNMVNTTGTTPSVTGLPFTGEVYTILPAVTAITRADADPTGAASVSWTVTFSSSVSGVSSGNFALANAGLSGTPAITSVTGSGTTWTVTASTGSGSGTLGLNMTGSGGVTPGVAGLPFTGEVYTVQRPTVTSFTLASTDPTTANTTVAWTIVFSAAVTGVDATDFILVEAGGVTGSSITTVTGSGTTWTVTANTGTSDTGTLGLNLVDDDSIVNGVGTPLGGTGVGNGDYTGPYYTLEPPAPNLAKTASAAAAVVGDVVTFTLTATNPYASPLANVVLTDTLPAGMSYVTHVATLGSVSIAGQIVTWTIPTLPALGSAQMTLAVSLSQQGPLTNTVTAPGATPASASILVLASAVTHFRMDEPVASWTGAAGEVIDSGGTALHGRRLTSTSPTATNVVDPNPTILSQHPSVIGGFCNAAYFDRRAIVEVADSPRFDYTTQLSASAWIYPTAYPSSDLYSILSNDVNYEFHLNTQGKLYWWWNASTLTSATTIPLNQWTHVAITFDSSAGVRRQRIYINGVLDGNTNNWQGTLQPNNCNFYIGGDIATGASCSILPGRNFQGMIDEVKLYSFELSPEEVVADMTLGRSCSGTFDHVRIEHDGSGSICAPERVTVKACLDSDCTTLYPGSVTVNLAPTGWVGGSTFSFSGGIASRQLSISTAGSVTLGTNSVSPLPAGITRCFNGATETCVMTFASASCAFDAVEQGANPQTPIFTKLANTNFNIDVLALLNATTINSSYTGPVAVDLVDTSSSACPTGAGLNTATNITFAAGDAGRKTVTFNYPGAARNVRVRAVVGASAPACSTDNFAIRPTGFTVTSSDATNNAASGTPVIKAGTAFNLSAAAVAGYNSTPLIDNTKVSGTPVAGAIGGSFAAAAAATGIASGSSFTYSEVGNFGLAQNAVYDATFTTVDQPDDCTAGFSNTLSGGKYGCSFGSAAVTQATGSSGFGRFIPARFNISANTPLFDPACGAFTYLGEPLPYLTAPALTVTALNASGSVTNNYGGAYWKLAPALGGRSYTDNSGTTSTLSVATAGTLAWTDTANSDGDGVVTLTGESLDYSKPATPIAPFAANVDLNFSATFLTDGDAVCYDPENDATCNSFSIASIAGTELRWGRVRLGNAHGSELIDLNVPLVAEHFDGASASFITNVADTCTAGVTLGVADVDATDGLTPAEVCAWDTGAPGVSGIGCAAVGAANLQYQAPPDLVGQEGSFNLWLQAPGAGNTGSVDITATVPAWLQFDWTGAGNSNPAARITFGIFGGSPRHIYLRERY